MIALGSLREAAKLYMLQALRPVDALSRAIGRKDPIVLLDIEGDIKPGSFDRLCLFAHYDRDCLIDDYVIYYMSGVANKTASALRTADFNAATGAGSP